MASPQRKTRALGETQKDILRSLREHKRWYPNCGWVWDGDKSTARRLDVLVERGLVGKEVQTLGVMSFGEPTGTSFEQECYVLTTAGQQQVDLIIAERIEERRKRSAR